MTGPGDTEAMPVAHDDLLDQVLADYLRAVAAGTPPDRETLLARYPELAVELSGFFADQDRFQRLAAPLRAAVADVPHLPLPTQVGPHDVLGEIARGGMGVVLRARHRGLGRLVALKLLLAGPFTQPDDVHRFRREAEAVASLDHPHIVPIYEVGDYQGLPYFTMKLMEGSLAQRLRAARCRGLGGTEAARVVATVARAVQHAHARGILHRDLKPGNILLDEQGQPHVSDFGLARQADTRSLTSTGAVLGTPAYMAPEQAAGKAAQVTVVSDVYSLGAVLYECLTGRPPFRGDTPLDTLRQVLDTDPVRPRALDPRIDADLETICLKCLDKDQARRYQGSGELADELDRYLAGEPIRARRRGVAARLWRQARRQPLVAALVLALCLAVTAGFSLVLQQWYRAEAGFEEASRQRDEAEQALAQAEEAQASANEATRAAEASFQQAHAAVNEFCVSLGDELSRRPGLQGLHRKLVHRARLYYQEFVRQRGHEPTLRRELADTHVRLARISTRLGERRQALPEYEEALTIYRALHQAQPDDVVVQRKLADTLSEFAALQELRQGLKTSSEALALYRRFLARRPDDRELAGGLNWTLSNRGSMMIKAGRFDEASRYLYEALVEQQQLVERYPWSAALWSELGNSLDNFGVCLSRQGHHSESLCFHVRAHEVRQWMLRHRPANMTWQANLATIRQQLGIALRDVGLFDAARDVFEQSLAARRKLAADNPLVTRYQVDLAGSLTNRGVMYNRDRQRESALKCFHQARKIHERLVELDPTSPGPRKLLGEAWFNIGTTNEAMKRRVEGGEAFRRARQLQEALVEAEPDNAEYRSELGRTLNNLGINLWVRKQERESREVLHQAIASTSKLVERAPGVLSYRRLLNAHYGLLAEIEWRLGNLTVSVELVMKRWKLWTDEPKELFNAGCELARAAAALGNDPNRLPAPRRAQQARWIELALTALTQAVEHGYADARRFRGHVDLTILRGRPEYDSLAARVDERARQHQPL
jgi:tetratricopeptide (TPR) repeat protein